MLHPMPAALLTFQLLQLLHLLLQLLRLLPHNLAQAAHVALARLPKLLPHIRWGGLQAQFVRLVDTLG